MKNAEFVEIRKSFGYTRREMAEVLGASPHTVEKWEQGHRNIPEYVIRLMRCLALAGEQRNRLIELIKQEAAP